MSVSPFAKTVLIREGKAAAAAEERRKEERYQRLLEDIGVVPDVEKTQGEAEKNNTQHSSTSPFKSTLQSVKKTDP